MKRSTSSLAVLLCTATVVVALAGCGSDSSSSSSTSTTTAPSTSTSAPSSSTSAPSGAQPTDAIWPTASGSLRFDDPVAAAGSFVVDYLGFTTPIVGELASSDGRSGEVPVMTRGGGPVTTVQVSRLAPDDTWWVLGATTPNLQLTVPAPSAAVSSPVTLEGRSTAFEGTVAVQVREDDATEPLARDFVTGGANGEMGPFSKAVPFTTPSAEAGAIVLSTSSGEDGRMQEATVVRVSFG